MNAILISSQRYLDDEIVEQKRIDRDYMVTVTPEFEYEGNLYRVVIDGHHRLAAARLDGVEPEIVEATKQQDDRIALLGETAESYLEVSYVDSDWYDVTTGIGIW
jgi:hypothetical protein